MKMAVKPSHVAVTVLLMATDKSHPGLRNAIDSLVRQNYLDNSTNSLRYRIVGAGEKWGGWPHRMRSYRDAAALAAKEDPNSLVVCMDAYDALSVRNGSNLVQVFESFGKPLVLGMERVCGGNCKSIRDWWRSHGEKHASYLMSDGTRPRDRYVNGGLLMGQASAIRDVYDWMLKDGAKDDQIGLAKYVLAHRDSWAPDTHGKIFKNRVFGAQLNSADLAGHGCFFAHFPGMRDWDISAYDYTVEKLLKRKSGMKSRNMGSPNMLAVYIVAIVIVSVAILLVAWTLLPLHLKPKSLQNLGTRLWNEAKKV